MDETNGFLIRYDLASTDQERWNLLAEEFSHPIDQQVFRQLVDDPITRAMFELEYNGSIRFEDYGPLLRAGLIFHIGEYRPRLEIDGDLLDPTLDIAKTPKGRRWRPTVPHDCDAYAFLAPYVEAYLWRSTSEGIVASRDLLESAVQSRDLDALRLIRNTMTGGVYLPAEHPDIWQAMLDETPAGDITSARRSELKWWTREERPVKMHDMSGQPPAARYYDFVDDDSYDDAWLDDNELSYHEHYLNCLRRGCV